MFTGFRINKQFRISIKKKERKKKVFSRKKFSRKTSFFVRIIRPVKFDESWNKNFYIFMFVFNKNNPIIFYPFHT